MNLRYKGFRFRALISLLMAVGFISLAVSGVVLYTAPPCSLAASTGWTFSGFSKDSWASLHSGMAVIIVFTAIVHLFLLNWKTFVLHLRSVANRKDKQRFRLSIEVIIGGVLAIILITSALGQAGPFGWIHETGERIKEHYRQEHRVGVKSYPGDDQQANSAEVRDGTEHHNGRGLGPDQGGRGVGRNRQ